MEELYILSEKADEKLSNGEKVPTEIINEISGLIKCGGFIGLAQINPIAGNIEYNAKKIARYIKYSEEIGLEMVVFPELVLCGFPLEDSIGKYSVIAKDNVKWLNGLAKLTGKTTAVVGFLEPVEDNPQSNKYYNSVAIMKAGEVKTVIRKSFIPSNPVSNDYKYVKPQYKLKNIYDNFAVYVGDDCWNDNSIDNEELNNKKLSAVINCCAYPARAGSESLIHQMLLYTSRQYSAPLVYVNQVGAADNISFEGSSKVFDSSGRLIARAKSFEEQLLIVNPLKNIGKIYPSPSENMKIEEENEGFTLDYESDLERTYKTVIQGIKDYFSKCGLKRAVLGLSGGLDSTVCAVLLADALGKENVIGISMPSKITSKESKSDAEILAKNLGIAFFEAPIAGMVNAVTDSLDNVFVAIEKQWNCRYKNSFTSDNIQARSRAVLLWGISNEFEACIPIATSDKSESYVGYATINGDMSGGFAPIADITKTKLFALARWLNKNRVDKNVIPESIILKRPGAELAINPKTGKPLIAEDAIMPYEFLDEIIWRIENKNEGYSDFQETKFYYEKKNDVSKEQKIEWLDKFYRRMSTALYKWSILPPSVIVESHSINKSEYKQPIVTAKINYKGVTDDEVIKALESIS